MRVAGAPYAIDRVIQEPNWDTIDMVKHGDHLYSSKPPLLPTLMAAVYWPIYRLFGASLGTHPYEIGRVMLVVFNLLPLLAYFVLLACLIERFGTSTWGRMFTFAAATFGTLLTTFAVAINNHLPAAVCTAAAVYAAVRLVFDGQWRPRYFVAAGLFGGLAAASEFPALALLAVLGAVLLWRDWRGTLCGFLPAALVVAGAFSGPIGLHTAASSRPICTTRARTTGTTSPISGTAGKSKATGSTPRASTAASPARRSTP